MANNNESLVADRRPGAVPRRQTLGVWIRIIVQVELAVVYALVTSVAVRVPGGSLSRHAWLAWALAAALAMALAVSAVRCVSGPGQRIIVMAAFCLSLSLALWWAGDGYQGFTTLSAGTRI